MFATSQPWQKKDDYKNLIEGLEPPPPPGSESSWELHFCKWWGWNWVKKKEEKEVQEPLIQRSVAPKPLEQKNAANPEKKPVKHLCHALSFKKKKDQDLQKIYNTPSNSVIENFNKQVQTPLNESIETKNKKGQTRQYMCETTKVTCENCRNDSVVQKDIEDQVVKDVNDDFYQEKKKKESRSSSSSDDYEYPSKLDRTGSSTEESVEYINITCCPYCHPKEPSYQKKRTNEKYTQGTPWQNKTMATQTKETEKKRKRRHIYVVCCCQCHQNYPSPCYGCHDIEGSRENGHVHKCRESPFREREVYRTNVNYAPPFEKEHKKLTTKQPTHLNKKFEPLYMTGLPIDDMLYHNKPFMKFGVPSQSYSWVHATKSDIWDQFSHTRSQEFSSPVSGKTYNISPTKIHNPEPELSQFNPLSIEAEMQNLKKIESDIKMDLKSRIMLDAVCDAILANDKEVDTSSSILLNEFISPNITQTEHIINDLYKSEQTRICSKLNETSLNGVRFENVMNNSNKKVNCETNTSRWSLNLGNQENNSPNYPNVHSPHMYTTENSCRRLFHNPFVSFDYNLVSNQNKGPHKLVDYSVVNNQPYITTKKELIPIRTKLIPTSKRSASPGIRAKDVKKVKLGKSSPLSNFHSTNTSDIFKKIDEIVSRSNVNKEMQSVLNTIPRTFQFFTSLEVSNLTKQNPPLQNNEVVNSCVIGMGEEKKERDDKTKALQMKKKKIYNRPSMIPKRVTDSKLNKKNASQ